MENTLENKAKFFAQYWGQQVMQDVNNAGEPCIYPVAGSNMYRIAETKLLLKPLTSLTDEDLEGIYPHDAESFFRYYGVGTGKKTVSIAFFLEKATKTDIDLLRLRGYAVDWAELSVEQLVEYGWVKLKI